MPRTALLVLLAALAAPQRPAYVVPNFRDLKLKIRQTHGLMFPQVTVWYLKGPRQRVEHLPATAPRNFVPPVASIEQCDQRTMIHLRPRDKTYSSYTKHVEREGAERPIRRPQPQPTGPEVLVTVNSVDTGERRQVGSYEARHIRTTVTVEPGRGAETKPGSVEADSWYLDLPGLHCLASNPRRTMPLFPGFLMAPHHDHVVFKHVGIEPQGLVIEETSVEKSDGNVMTNKTELLEVSEQPLDDSLFEVPPDFTQAQPHMEMQQRIEPEGDAH